MKPLIILNLIFLAVLLSSVSCSIFSPIEIPKEQPLRREIITDKITPLEIFQSEQSVVPDSFNYDKQYIRLMATGDMMLGSRITDINFIPDSLRTNFFSEGVIDILNQGDITFGNLEGPICSFGGDPSQKKYAFSMPDNTTERLLEAGYNLLSVANNHSLDMGEYGNFR